MHFTERLKKNTSTGYHKDSVFA